MQHNIVHKIEESERKYYIYPVIRLVEVSDVEISIDSRLGHEKAMQASIVASTSLQHPTINEMNSRSMPTDTIYFINIVPVLCSIKLYFACSSDKR